MAAARGAHRLNDWASARQEKQNAVLVWEAVKREREAVAELVNVVGRLKDAISMERTLITSERIARGHDATNDRNARHQLEREKMEVRMERARMKTTLYRLERIAIELKAHVVVSESDTSDYSDDEPGDGGDDGAGDGGDDDPGHGGDDGPGDDGVEGPDNGGDDGPGDDGTDDSDQTPGRAGRDHAHTLLVDAE